VNTRSIAVYELSSKALYRADTTTAQYVNQCGVLKSPVFVHKHAVHRDKHIMLVCQCFNFASTLLYSSLLSYYPV
jgi:hypothetical protein